ncbi:class II glutamine amidotransferase [Streptomyces arboris]|uniref:class II glutamine amidotransferase n=1 Tax=Streptomyces arboris TaxID=2600619 RepID=UPI003BF5342E
MCGLFAYTGPADPDPDQLQAAAAAAAARGPHGHGWATSGHAHHALGPLAPRDVRTIQARAVIGHARLATVGDYRDPAQLQPLTADGHQLAHNGTVHNWPALAPHATTDSAVLASRYAHARTRGLAPAAALATVLEGAQTDSWALVVLDADGTLLHWRQRLPIWAHRDPTGLYLASRRHHPDARPTRPDTIHEEGP